MKTVMLVASVLMSLMAVLLCVVIQINQTHIEEMRYAKQQEQFSSVTEIVRVNTFGLEFDSEPIFFGCSGEIKRHYGIKGKIYYITNDLVLAATNGRQVTPKLVCRQTMLETDEKGAPEMTLGDDGVWRYDVKKEISGSQPWFIDLGDNHYLPQELVLRNLNSYVLLGDISPNPYGSFNFKTIPAI